LPSNGELLIGTGSGFSLGTLTPGNNIAIVNEGGAITISSTGVNVVGSNVGIGTTNPQKSLDVVGDVGVNGTLYMTGNVMPTATETYDLGSSTMRFRELYLSGNTIYLGSNLISVNEAGQVDVGNVYAENFIGLNLTATNITAGTANITNLSVSGTLDAKLDTNTVQIGTNAAQIVNIGTSTLTQTINVGTGSGVTTINIGGAGDLINIAGNTTITDNRITLNKGGAAGSGSGAGFTVEEDESQAGHVKTTSSREGWELKAPATSGVVTVVPGAAGFEISSSNMWTASTGNNVYRPLGGVGIGTVPASSALEVVGTVKATSFVGDGSLLTDITSTGTSVWTPSSSNVYVIGSNVGIGLTNPTSKLHVVGDTRIEGNLTVNGTQTIVNTNVGTTEQLIITNDGTGPALVVNQTGAQPVLDIQDDGVSVLKIIDGGNVGVGTTIPVAKFHVHGNGARFQSPEGNTTNFIDIYSSADSVTRSSSGLTFWGNPVFSNGDNGVRNAARIYGGFINEGVDNWANGFVTIATAGATGNNGSIVDTLTVRKGNVGIGTTNPQAKLHVNGFIKNSNPSCSVAFSNGTSHYSTAGYVPWNRIFSNPGNYYNTSTFLFTAPITGSYFVQVAGLIATGSPSNLGLLIRINGIDQQYQYLYTSIRETTCSQSHIFDVPAGHTIGIWNVGTIHAGVNAHNGFTCYLIG
jgi:hypothetical protein